MIWSFILFSRGEFSRDRDCVTWSVKTHLKLKVLHGIYLFPPPPNGSGRLTAFIVSSTNSNCRDILPIIGSSVDISTKYRWIRLLKLLTTYHWKYLGTTAAGGCDGRICYARSVARSGSRETSNSTSNGKRPQTMNHQPCRQWLQRSPASSSPPSRGTPRCRSAGLSPCSPFDRHAK